MIRSPSCFYLQPFHLVSSSPWPLLLSLSLLLVVCSFLFSLQRFSFFPLWLSLGFFTLVLVSWLNNVVSESTYLGSHTVRVQSGLRLSVVLFIISECFFFLRFFWAYIHCALSPNVELGSLWPPLGITPLDYSSIPLLNTTILLSSALFVSAAHSSLLSSSPSSCFFFLSASIFLGFFFSSLQAFEYFLCSFTASDSAYGSCFFLATGFHGVHVIIGTLWLASSLPRLLLSHYTSCRHLCLEASIWYWHFVDVIWLCLYIMIYIWGS